MIGVHQRSTAIRALFIYGMQPAACFFENGAAVQGHLCAVNSTAFRELSSRTDNGIFPPFAIAKADSAPAGSLYSYVV